MNQFREGSRLPRETDLCSFVSNDFLSGTTVVSQAGSGAYGTVATVRDRNGNYYAVKNIPIRDDKYDKGIAQNALYEIDALIRLSHAPYIVQLIGVCYRQSSIAVILEKMDGDLIKFVLEHNFTARILYLVPLLQALIGAKAAMEMLNITHYDIKPDNVLYRVTGGPGSTGALEFKLSDFGMTRISYSDYISNVELFSAWYRPPEYIAERDRRSFGKYSGDIWSIGMTLLVYLLGTNIFGANTNDEILMRMQLFTSEKNSLPVVFFDKIRKGEFIGNIDVKHVIASSLGPEALQFIKPEIIALLTYMLEFEPSHRPTANEIQTISLDIAVDPSIIAMSIPPIYRRQIDRIGIDLLFRLNVACVMSAAALLMSIEMFTRFLGTIDAPIVEGSYDLIAIACCRIANLYTEGLYRSNAKFILAYNSIMLLVYQRDICLGETTSPRGKICVTIDSIFEAEKILLTQINYHIYNIHLTDVIKYIYASGTTISSLNIQTFSQPVTQWLIASI